MFSQSKIEYNPSNNENNSEEILNTNKLSQPKILYNPISVESLTPTFNWEKVEGANGYTFYIYELKNGKEFQIFNSSFYGIISGQEFTVFDGYLNYNTQYSLSMRAFNSIGWSDYSDKYIFSIERPEKEITLDYPNVINKDSLIWESVPSAESYIINIEGITTNSIFGDEYTQLVKTILTDTLFQIDSLKNTKYDKYRWRVKSVNSITESKFSPYYYFTPNGEIKFEHDSAAEEIVMRLKYAGFIDEMVIAHYKDEKVFLPLIEIFSILQLNHNFDNETKIFSGTKYDKAKTNFKFDLTNNTLKLGDEIINIPKSSISKSELEYFLNKETLEKLIGMDIEIDMKNLTVRLTSDFILPMFQRMINEKNLSFYKNSQSEKSYPLLFNRERRYLSGGFLDYSATSNYVKDQSPYYSFSFGLGAEVLGGDIQMTSQQTFLDNKITYSELRYKWRYAFLNNDYVSNVSLGHNNSFGLQSYNFKGIQISNEPLEARRLYGKYEVEEKTKPLWKIEVYHNNQLIDILQADEKGNYSFLIPFSYGTTLLELHQIGPHGELEIKNKLYQIPIEQVPKGRLDYSTSFGQIINTKDYIFQSDAAYGISNWLTTKIGTDVFTNDIESSSIYSNTTARLFDGYIANLTIAPNAFHELSLNSIFTDLASFSVGAKIYEQNEKLNPSKIKNEIEGNVFLPVRLDQNMMSFLLRGRFTDYSSTKRTDISLRTFYNFRSFSPSIELDYYNVDNGFRNYESTYLNLRLNYSLYIPSPIFSGNIIDARYIYDLMKSESESMSISVSTTVLQKFRVQISHTNNFNNSYSDTQLRVVFDLPFFRSNTTVSKNVMSQSFIGSVNYNQHLKEFNYYNRGMIGRSAATFKFFVDKNKNEHYDEGENLIPNMDIQINSIGNKKRVDEGNIIVNDLESYSQYDVKLVDRYNKNPLWFPYKDKFSFISDPHQFKEIEIPFYEAAEVFGTVSKNTHDKLVPISGVNIIFEENETLEITKIKTMSDGSFYQYGLKPGKYRIYLDQAQLDRLGLTSIPADYDSSIQSISNEEEFTEFNFILK